jgi:hypothetical protein
MSPLSTISTLKSEWPKFGSFQSALAPQSALTAMMTTRFQQIKDVVIGGAILVMIANRVAAKDTA